MFTTATPGRARVEHREQRGDAAERRAVAGAGRHADHGRGHEPADHGGERRVLAGDDDHAVRAPQVGERGREPVQPGDARVRVHDDRRAEQLRPHARLVHHRPVRRAAGDDRDQPARLRHVARDPREPRALVLLARPARRAAAPPRAAASARVTSTLPAPPSSSARAIASISSGVLPSARIASGAPWRSSRCVSTRAKPRSRNGCMGSASATTGSVRCRHAATEDTATRERKALDGLGASPSTPRGRAARALVGRALRAPARCPCRRATTTSSPRPAVRDHVGDAWYQTSVRVPARLGRRAHRPALRRRDAPRGRLARRHAGRRARGRLHAVRGRRHRPRRAGRREPGHRGGRTTS